MEELSDIELLVILGFYYVGKEKGVDKFTVLFNLYFGKDFSVQTILHEVSRFRNVDPSNNVSVSAHNLRYQEIWNDYIGKDKLADLRTLYKSFRGGEFAAYMRKSDNLKSRMTNDDDHEKVADEPKEIIYTTSDSSTTYKRDHIVVENALYAAN